MRQHLHCPTVILEHEELWKKRMHSILIQDWKEILSMDFMKVKKSVMGRRTLGLRYGVSPF